MGIHMSEAPWHALPCVSDADPGANDAPEDDEVGPAMELAQERLSDAIAAFELGEPDRARHRLHAASEAIGEAIGNLEWLLQRRRDAADRVGVEP